MGLLSFLFGNKTDLPGLVRGGALLIDARSEAEFSSGHIEGAVNIPHNIIAAQIGQHEADKKRPIVVYCQSGGRSAMAVSALRKSGYTLVENGGAIAALRRKLEADHA